jgi:hypothetical protein
VTVLARVSNVVLLICWSCLLLSASPANAAPGVLKLENIGACNESSVPDSVRRELAQNGYRITLEGGSTVEVWPRSKIAADPKVRDDQTYTLAPSTFVGVIHFSTSTRDYRGNAIPGGFYNLRYALQPADGDHLGTSPTPDFVLLIPPAADPEPDKAYRFDQLVELSRKVTGKRHPGPLNLAPPDTKEFPSVKTDSDDHTILFFKTKTESGELPVALVIKGTTTS